MNPDARLAEIVAALEAVGLNCLVMGGHAVRFYGLDRNTGDQAKMDVIRDSVRGCLAKPSLRLQQAA